MKRRKTLLFVVLWISSLIATYRITIVTRSHQNQSKLTLREEKYEWEEIMTGNYLGISGESVCGHSGCGYHRLLAIWAPMDLTVKRWNDLSKPGFVDQLNDPSKSRYFDLLPIFKGALYGSRSSFPDYLVLRSEIARRLPQGQSNLLVKRFFASVQTQQQDQSQSPRNDLAGVSFVSESCRDYFVKYLEAGQHFSLDEEGWIVRVGQVYARLFDSNQPRPGQMPTWDK